MNPWELPTEETPPWELPAEGGKPAGTAADSARALESELGVLGSEIEGAAAQAGAAVKGEVSRRFQGPSTLWTRFQLGRHDKPSETDLYLDKRFGAGNWMRDEGNRILVRSKRGEAPVPIDFLGPDVGDVAEFGGSIAGPLVGGIAAGALTSGAGFIPGVLASGAGSAAGKAVDELIKYAQGTSDKTQEELLNDIKNEGVTGAIGEGVFRLAIPALSKLIGPHTTRPLSLSSIFAKRNPLVSTVDPARLEKLGQALEAGYRPHVSVATDKNLAGRVQSAAEFIMGNPREPINKRVMIDERNKLVASVGGKGKTEGELLDDFLSEEAVEKAGAGISEEAKVSGDLMKQALVEADVLASATDRKLRLDLLNSFEFPSEKAGAAVRESLNKNVRAFYNQAKVSYKLYDELAGGASIDISPVKSVVRDYLGGNVVRTTASGEQIPVQIGEESSLRFLNQLLGIDDLQTATKLNTLRTAIRSGIDDSVLPGVPTHVRRQIIRAIDTSLDNAAEAGNIPEAAVAHLKQTRAWYADEIAKFDNKTISTLLQDPSRASYIPEDRIIDFVSDLKSGVEVARVKTLVPPKVWRQVESGVWENWMQDIASPNRVIDAGKLADKVDGNMPVLRALFGQEKANKIRTYSKFLQAKNGDLSLDMLPDKDPFTVLRKKATEQKNYDDAWTNVKDAAELVTTGNYPVERLVPTILKSNDSRKILQLKSLLGGEDSPAWQTFKQASMEKVLQKLVSRSDDGVKVILNPKEFGKAISPGKVSPAAMSAIFGREVYTDMLNFARLAQFATTQRTLGAGAIAAAQIALHPTQHLGSLLRYKVIGTVMSRPGFLRYMTEGITNPAARGALRNAARITAQTVAQVTGETAGELTGAENYGD